MTDRQLDEQPEPASADAGTEIEALRAQLEAARTQADDYLGALQRERADFANFRRKTAEERDATLGLASESLLRKVLALADDFDRAIEQMPGELRDSAWVEGVVAIDRKLRAVLESEGLTPIDAVGRPFDPREHEAVTGIPGSGRPDGEVLVEVRRGYRIRDRVLRPSLVAVAQGEAGTPDSGSGSETGRREPTN